MPERAPADLAARYRIDRVLARNATATVYVAHDPVLDRDVAVKVFEPSATSGSELRVEQAEAHLAATLNHHALATVFDAGVDRSAPDRPRLFVVMEYLAAGDLRQRLGQEGALTPDQVCWLGFDLADALQYVHESGFIHRDIKPANVLLTSRRSGLRVRGKLTDFGIAAIIGERDDNDFTSGTAAYLSPEHVAGYDATAASDVYSLGLVLLECLTTRLAFPGTPEDTAIARLTHDPDIPESVPVPLADLLRRMTSRSPADRPTPHEAADRLQEILVDNLIDQRGIDRSLLAADESQRMAALRRYDVLDTPPDAAFDAVTKLATRVLGVPIAMVTIIDTDRVWFKSKRGVDFDEVGRDVAFCSTTYPGGREAWSVPDVFADDRTRANPLVTGDTAVRSYAAAPLVTHDGHQLGALCVFDRTAREFDPDQLEDLTDLAGILMRELELRIATRRAVFAR